VASFTSELTNILAYEVTFTNTSTVSSSNINVQTWEFGDTNTSSAENPVHNYPGSGLYNVTLTVTTEDGCMGSATSVLDLPSDIHEINKANSISCYPNPASDLLHIITTKPAYIVMTDLTGKIVWQKSIQNTGDHIVDVSNLASGVYFLGSLNDTFQNKTKVVISRK